jgi:predicted nucleic acid-binding protein
MLKILQRVYTLAEKALARGISYETIGEMPIHQQIRAMKLVQPEEVLEKFKNLFDLLPQVFQAVGEER